MTRNPSPARRRHRRPVLESLEVRQVPAVMLGLTNTNEIAVFQSDNTTNVGRLAIKNAEPGITLRALDVRTSDGLLYILGSNSAGSGRLYRAHLAASGVTLTTLPVAFTLSSPELGMDFDPVTNRLRVVTRTDQNLSIDPDTGSVFTETALTYGSGQSGDPDVVAIAYTNNFQGATSATVFGYDADRDELVRIGNSSGSNPASAGKVFKVADVNTTALSDSYQSLGMDIDSAGNAFILVNSSSFPTNRFRQIDLSSGDLDSVGTLNLPSGTTVRDIAVAPAARIELESSTVDVDEAAGTVSLRVKRSGDNVGSTTVNFTTFEGTATTPEDYLGRNQSVTFADGEEFQTITVPIVNDSAKEGAETFGIRISLPSGSPAVLGSVRTATVTIAASDQDSTPPSILPPVVIRVGRRKNQRFGSFRVTFNEAVDGSAVASGGTYILRVAAKRKRAPAKQIAVAGVTYDPATRTVTITPVAPIKKDKRVSLVIVGAAGVRDLAGNRLNNGADLVVPLA